MAGGVLRRGMTGHAQHMDVHGRAGKPLAQAASDRFALALAELGDKLGHAAGSQVMGQTGDDPLLNVLSRGAAVAKPEGIYGRGNKGRIGGDEIETFSANGVEQVALYGFQVGDAQSARVEARATDGARIDIHGAHAPRVRGGQQGVNAGAGTHVEGRADWPADGGARQIAAIEAGRHDLIGGNGGMTRMGKLGPCVIGEDQPPADGNERRPRSRDAGFFDFEQRRSEQNFAAGSRQQSVQFAGGEASLQQEEVDGKCHRIAFGQALVAVNGKVAPMEVAQVPEPEALPHRGLAIPGAANFGNRPAQGGHIGIVDQEGSALRHCCQPSAVSHLRAADC
jgi:hypothetical protein